MDFSFNEDQNAIRELAQQIFTDRATDEFLLEFDRSDKVYDDQLWSTLAEQGLLGITIPEQFGGTGLGFTELCLILEEQGRRVAPSPVYASLVLGVLPIAEFASDALKQQYLSGVASGEIKLTAAIAELGMSDAFAGEVTVGKNGGDHWVLNGRLDCVPDGMAADAILVPAKNPDGTKSIFIVDSKLEGVEREAQESSLGNNEATLTLNNVSCSKLLGGEGDGDVILAWLEQRADIAICALQVGVTEEALRRTAEFTTERKQFGQPIGAFQAVAMQAADAYIDVEAIRSSYWLALYKLESEQDARIETRIAKWFASDAGHRIVHRTQHLHGGMGSDLEFPIHRFFLWAKHLGFMIGGRSVQITKLGELLASDDSVGLAALNV